MEFQTLLETRRSVRSYLPGGKPDAETIKKLIAAAQEAPSWKNTETGRYHCVLSDEMTAKFQETCLPPFNATRSTNAAYLVATYVRDVSGYNVHEKTPENEAGNGWRLLRPRTADRKPALKGDRAWLFDPHHGNPRCRCHPQTSLHPGRREHHGCHRCRQSRGSAVPPEA